MLELGKISRSGPAAQRFRRQSSLQFFSASLRADLVFLWLGGLGVFCESLSPALHTRPMTLQRAFERERPAAFGVGGAEDLKLVGEVAGGVGASGDIARE